MHSLERVYVTGVDTAVVTHQHLLRAMEALIAHQSVSTTRTRRYPTQCYGARRLAEREAELKRLALRINQQLTRRIDALRLENDQRVLSPLEAKDRP